MRKSWPRERRFSPVIVETGDMSSSSSYSMTGKTWGARRVGSLPVEKGFSVGRASGTDAITDSENEAVW